MKIVFLGPPGAGKGTYSSRIGKILGIPHISTGDIFREAVKNGTELGDKVSKYLKGGELVPDEITIEVLKDRIRRPDCSKGFILDGYPRTISQAKELDKITKIDIVLNLNLHEDILIKKLSARRICKVCGEIYNVVDIKETIEGVEYNMASMLPKTLGICDKCGGELIQRKDDVINVIKERLNVYKAQTEPLINYYRNRRILEDIFVNANPEVMIPKIMAKLCQ